MMYYLYTTFLAMFLLCACTQDDSTKAIREDISLKPHVSDSSHVSDNFLLDRTVVDSLGPVYMLCEKMPEFPGGETAFHEYLRNHIHYPQAAYSDKLEGRVNLRFIINAAGHIENIKVIRGIRSDMDEKCVRGLAGMPSWKPGSIGNKPVSVSYGITVRFLLKKTENLNGIYILP